MVLVAGFDPLMSTVALARERGWGGGGGGGGGTCAGRRPSLMFGYDGFGDYDSDVSLGRWSSFVRPRRAGSTIVHA